MKNIVIIPAAGSGSRFGSKTPKQFLKLPPKNIEVISYTIKKFQEINSVNEIIIATSSDNFKKLKKIISDNKFSKVSRIVEGGETRHQSGFNALLSLKCGKDDRIIIHDAVRPFITKKKIKELIKLSIKYPELVPGLKVNDTIKKIDDKNFISESLKRENIWRIQTPQIFRYEILVKSFEHAHKTKFIGTDESSIVTNAGYKVKIVEGEISNLKITTKEDLKIINFNKLLIS
ncbi:MAG TPA: 2-C-methyl-D-erythritol 4-phosphate cytidylyltransferase [Ignavibacteria bacterium]|nr:2-C-methyl-D-erythritol 4-phosphate cytidylyltransferase [Ignavibacteria bacterium]